MKISLVVPVYNEEETIELFHKTVRSNSQLTGFDIEIVFINDGSSDKSELIIRQLIDHDKNIQLVNLSRNFGKEPALFAGIEQAKGDAIIPIDVDLQDPIEVIPLMIEKWQEGADVVLAKRADRSSDSRLKRKTAELFYRLHNSISHVSIPENVGDFRLMDRKVVEELKKLPENQLFMKGLFSWIGFDTVIVEYQRQQRSAGDSKFNGWKLWNFALEGITSFSTLPLRMWTYIGIFVSLSSFIYAAIHIIDKLINGNPVAGYTSLICVMLLLGGIQLIGIGVIGEYIGRIYQESKQRPKYIIKNIIKKEE